MFQSFLLPVASKYCYCGADSGDSEEYIFVVCGAV